MTAVPRRSVLIEITADEFEIVTCPECGQPAFVEWRTHIEGTDGPVEHLKILCLDRHWFFLPASTVTDTQGQLSVAPTPDQPALG